MLWPAPVPRPFPVGGLPSTAYHCRSTAVSGTPVLLQMKDVPWSPDRAVLKLARVRSLKYRLPPVSTASSVSPPPAQGFGLPSLAVAAVTHLKVFPPSTEFQIQLVSLERDPGTLVKTRFGLVGSSRKSCSKPTPWMPLIVGCPKVGDGAVAAATGTAGLDDREARTTRDPKNARRGTLLSTKASLVQAAEASPQDGRYPITVGVAYQLVNLPTQPSCGTRPGALSTAGATEFSAANR